jgi:hypothetical protein
MKDLKASIKEEERCGLSELLFEIMLDFDV